MKTSELIGPALVWAVATCEGVKEILMAQTWDESDHTLFYYDRAEEIALNYPYDWSQGGPIIEHEGIFIVAPYKSATSWKAYKMEDDQPELPCWIEDGPTPLIAAMRCYVASKLGDEVEIPSELQP